MDRHLINNDIVDNIQSAYKAGNSCESALLRVYNARGRDNSAMVVLLYFSAAFDTIDRGILQKCVGNCGIALKLV